MQLAIHFPDFSLPGGATAIGPALAATARAADQGGVTTMTLMDHWFQMEARADYHEPMLEGYTSLGFLAGITERLRLGLLVTGVTYRQPGLLAKTVATLDVLSGGRAMLGIGAAWYEREHRSLGVPFPPLAQRFERLEETLRICRQMWSDDDGPFQGEHYSLEATICRPRPLQAPRPPVLIGGGGERKTLRLVAQYADADNLFDSGVDGLTHKLDVLRGHCDDVGRDFADIHQTVITQVDPLDADTFLSTMERYAAIGIDQVWVSAPMPDPAGWVTEVCERTLPRLAQIRSAQI